MTLVSGNSPFQSSAPNRAAVYSLCGALGVGILLGGIWWMMRPQEQRSAVQRRLSDVTVTWKCSNGHAFEEPASAFGYKCPTCGAAADVSVSYRCPEHGSIPAWVRYSRDDPIREQVTSISFRPPVWVSVTRSIRCPTCGKKMEADDPGMMRIASDRPTSPP